MLPANDFLDQFVLQELCLLIVMVQCVCVCVCMAERPDLTALADLQTLQACSRTVCEGTQAVQESPLGVQTSPDFTDINTHNSMRYGH